MYVQLFPIRERYTFTGYIFCIPVCFTMHNLASSDLQFPTAHTEVLKWLQKTLCSYGPSSCVAIPWGEWDGLLEQIMVNGGAPTVCLISLISLWRDLPQTDQGLSGFMVIPQEMLWYAALLTHQPEASTESGLWYPEFRARFTS